MVGVALFEEYESVFLRGAAMAKCPLSGQERQALLDAFHSVCEWVKVYFLWRPNLPDEANLVELATAGAAGTLVTRNVRDLVRGELNFPGLQILTPAQFLKNHPTP